MDSHKLKMQVIRRFPHRPLQIAEACLYTVNKKIYAGSTVECPVCDRGYRKFLTGPPPERRPDAICPGCGSLERHRLRMLYLRSCTDIFSRKQRLLHIAPEPGTRMLLSRIPTLDYVTGDLSSPHAGQRLDVTSLPFPDESFDAAICSHVLEHVVDDRKAIREFFRVIRPGGWAWLEAPIRPGLTKEAVGQLTAGIAHDFNNLLMGILGHTELALMALGDDSPARGSMNTVLQTGQRAAELVASMLAFGRGRA